MGAGLQLPLNEGCVIAGTPPPPGLLFLRPFRVSVKSLKASLTLRALMCSLGVRARVLMGFGEVLPSYPRKGGDLKRPELRDRPCSGLGAPLGRVRWTTCVAEGDIQVITHSAA